MTIKSIKEKYQTILITLDILLAMIYPCLTKFKLELQVILRLMN